MPFRAIREEEQALSPEDRSPPLRSFCGHLPPFALPGNRQTFAPFSRPICADLPRERGKRTCPWQMPTGRPSHGARNPAYNRAMGRTKPVSVVAAIILCVPFAVRAQSSPHVLRPIPSIASLMREVLANQDQVDRLRENYSCTDTRTVRKLGKHGRVKKTDTYIYQVSFFGPLEVDRLIEKNGRPLSAHAQKNEDKRIAKEMKKYEKKNG